MMMKTENNEAPKRRGRPPKAKPAETEHEPIADAFEPAPAQPEPAPEPKVTVTESATEIVVEVNIDEIEAAKIFSKHPKVNRIVCPAYFFNRFTMHRQ